MHFSIIIYRRAVNATESSSITHEEPKPTFTSARYSRPLGIVVSPSKKRRTYIASRYLSTHPSPVWFHQLETMGIDRNTLSVNCSSRRRADSFQEGEKLPLFSVGTRLPSFRRNTNETGSSTRVEGETSAGANMGLYHPRQTINRPLDRTIIREFQRCECSAPRGGRFLAIRFRYSSRYCCIYLSGSASSWSVKMGRAKWAAVLFTVFLSLFSLFGCWESWRIRIPMIHPRMLRVKDSFSQPFSIYCCRVFDTEWRRKGEAIVYGDVDCFCTPELRNVSIICNLLSFSSVSLTSLKLDWNLFQWLVLLGWDV